MGQVSIYAIAQFISLPCSTRPWLAMVPFTTTADVLPSARCCIMPRAPASEPAWPKVSGPTTWRPAHQSGGREVVQWPDVAFVGGAERVDVRAADFAFGPVRC